MAAARSMSLRGVRVTPSAPTLASISGTNMTFSSPFGPFTLTVLPSTEAVTPFGSATGFLPIRDIMRSLEHLAEDFAAHILFPGMGVGHHALRRGDDRHTKTLAMGLEFLHRGINPTAWRRDALQFANDGLALVVLQFDFDFAGAGLQLDFRVAANETFVLQHIEQPRAKPRVRRLHLRQTAKLAVTDARQKIANGIGDRHFLRSPYQLAL